MNAKNVVDFTKWKSAMAKTVVIDASVIVDETPEVVGAESEIAETQTRLFRFSVGALITGMMVSFFLCIVLLATGCSPFFVHEVEKVVLADVDMLCVDLQVHAGGQSEAQIAKTCNIADTLLQAVAAEVERFISLDRYQQDQRVASLSQRVSMQRK